MYTNIKNIINDEDIESVCICLKKQFKYVIEDEETKDIKYVFTFYNGRINCNKNVRGDIKSNLTITYRSRDKSDYILNEATVEMLFHILSNRVFTVKEFVKCYNYIGRGEPEKIYKSRCFNHHSGNYVVIYYITKDMIESVKETHANVILRAFKSRKNNKLTIYAFYHGIFNVFSIDEALEKGLCEKRINVFNEPYLSYSNNIVFPYKSNLRLSLNINVMKFISRHMKAGDTIDKFIELYNNTTACRYWSNTIGYSTIESIVGTIDRPMICRDPENPKKNTFDYIRVGVRLCYLGNKDTRKEQIEFLKPYISQITQMVYQKLENYGPFKNKGVPINFLKVSKCTFTNDKCLEYIFELKDNVQSALKESIT